MKPIYTEKETTTEGVFIIEADFGNGHYFYIPKDESNSEYQRYLRWLNGEEENGTIS